MDIYWKSKKKKKNLDKSNTQKAKKHLKYYKIKKYNLTFLKLLPNVLP